MSIKKRNQFHQAEVNIFMVVPRKETKMGNIAMIDQG